MPEFVNDETLASQVSFKPVKNNNTLEISVNSRYPAAMLKSRQDIWTLDSQSLASSQEKAKERIASSPGSQAYLEHV